MVSVAEDMKDDESPVPGAAELAEPWRRRAAAEEAWWRRRAAGQHDEVLRQEKLMHGGLIAIGVVFVQQFLTATPAVIDLPARICVIAFAVAIPILAALVLLNSQETYRRRSAASMFVQVARQGAFGAGFVGVIAGFWHMAPVAGVTSLVAALLAVAVYTVGFGRVERDDAKVTSAGEGPEAPGS